MELVTRNAADIEPQPIEWLFEGFIPRGKITLFTGRPKTGKTALMMHLAARVSRGLPLGPSFAGKPEVGQVLISSSENTERSMIGRLKAEGADLSQVTFLAPPPPLMTRAPDLIIIDPVYAEYAAHMIADYERILSIFPADQKKPAFVITGHLILVGDESIPMHYRMDRDGKGGFYIDPIRTKLCAEPSIPSFRFADRPNEDIDYVPVRWEETTNDPA